MARGTAFREYDRRCTWGLVTIILGGWASAAPWGGPQWFQRLPAQLTDSYLAVVAVAVLAGLWRAWRMALYIDDRGVTVRNFFRSRRFTWPEVSMFDDGSAVGSGSERYWALRVVPREGTPVTAAATMRGLTPREELPSAIEQAAQRHGIPAKIDGIPPPKSGFHIGRGSL